MNPEFLDVTHQQHDNSEYVEILTKYFTDLKPDFQIEGKTIKSNININSTALEVMELFDTENSLEAEIQERIATNERNAINILEGLIHNIKLETNLIPDFIKDEKGNVVRIVTDRSKTIRSAAYFRIYNGFNDRLAYYALSLFKIEIPEGKKTIDILLLKDLARGAAYARKMPYIEKMLNDYKKQEGLHADDFQMKPEEFKTITKKMAWLDSLGVLDILLEISKEGVSYNFLKAARLLESFTGIDAKTSVRNFEAIFAKNDGNKRNHPLNNPDNRLYVDELFNKFKINKLDKKK